MGDSLKETVIYLGRSSSLAQVPKYDTERSTGMYISSAGRYILFPQQKVKVNTGLVVVSDDIISLNIKSANDFSFKNPFYVLNASMTVSPNQCGDLQVVLENESFPSDELRRDYNYVYLWTYLKRIGIKNGNLSIEDVSKVEKKFGEICDLKQKDNRTGIYLINPGDRIAQISMSDASRIKFITENFLSEEKIEYMKTNGYTEEEIYQLKEDIRKDHLAKVKALKHNLGGGFGSTGV